MIQECIRSHSYPDTPSWRRSPPSRAASQSRGHRWNNTWQSQWSHDLEKRFSHSIVCSKRIHFVATSKSQMRQSSHGDKLQFALLKLIWGGIIGITTLAYTTVSSFQVFDFRLICHFTFFFFSHFYLCWFKHLYHTAKNIFSYSIFFVSQYIYI